MKIGDTRTGYQNENYFQAKIDLVREQIKQNMDDGEALSGHYLGSDILLLLDYFTAQGNRLQEHEAKLSLHEQKMYEYQMMLNVSTDGFWSLSIPETLQLEDSTPAFWSQTFRQLLGYSDEHTFPNKLASWRNLLHPDDLEPTMNAIMAILKDPSGTTLYNIKHRLKVQSGEYRWFHSRGKVAQRDKLTLKKSRQVILVGSMHDIHEERMARLIFEGSVPALVTDHRFNILNLNEAVAKRAGCTKEEMRHTNIFSHLNSEVNSTNPCELKRELRNHGSVIKEASFKLRNGDSIPVLMHIELLHAPPAADSEEGINYLFSYIDITRQQEELRRIKHRSEHDPLTGCNNRLVFIDELEHFTNLARQYPEQQEKSGCLGIIDIDFFKKVNDTHGHPMGDKALVHVATLLQRMARSSDTVARIGGEEFAVLLAGTTLEQARNIFERIRRKIEESPIKYDEPGREPLSLTISVGVTNISPTGADRLFKLADQALYAAKESGRNQVCCKASRK